MGHFEGFFVPNNRTDAEFRAWAKFLSDSLTALGIPKTADTGQIDFTTITRPTVSDQPMGYEIRYFNDALNGTAPQYFKIEYGSSNNQANPGIFFTTGTGSDGAGNLTGYGMARREFYTSNGVTALPWWVSGNASGFVFVMAIGAGTQRWLWSHERTCDANGNIIGYGSHTQWHGPLAYPNGHPAAYNTNQQDAVSAGPLGPPGGLLPRPCQAAIAGNLGKDLPVAKGIGWTTHGIYYTKMVLSLDQMNEGSIIYPTIFGAVHGYRALNADAWGVRGETYDATGSKAVYWE